MNACSLRPVSYCLAFLAVFFGLAHAPSVVTLKRAVHDARVCLRIGIYIINLNKTYEKLLMAARIIVAVENPQVAALVMS